MGGVGDGIDVLGFFYVDVVLVDYVYGVVVYDEVV